MGVIIGLLLVMPEIGERVFCYMDGIFIIGKVSTQKMEVFVPCMTYKTCYSICVVLGFSRQC